MLVYSDLIVGIILKAVWLELHPVTNTTKFSHKEKVEIAQTVATQLRHLHYDNKFFKKKRTMSTRNFAETHANSVLQEYNVLVNDAQHRFFSPTKPRVQGPASSSTPMSPPCPPTSLAMSANNTTKAVQAQQRSTAAAMSRRRAAILQSVTGEGDNADGGYLAMQRQMLAATTPASPRGVVVQPVVPASPPRHARRVRRHVSLDHTTTREPQHTHGEEIRSTLASFVYGLFGEKERASQGVRDVIAELTTNELPKDCTYSLMHPLSYVKEATGVPWALAAWRTLKSVPVERANEIAREAAQAMEVDDTTARAVHPSSVHTTLLAARQAKKWFATPQTAPEAPPHKASLTHRENPSRGSSGCGSSAKVQEDTGDSSDSDTEADASARQMHHVQRALLARKVLWADETVKGPGSGADVGEGVRAQQSRHVTAAKSFSHEEVAQRKQEIFAQVLARREG